MARRLARAGRGSLILQRSELRLHLYLRGTDTLVGSSGLQGIDWEVPTFEIGYWCRTGFTGRGYITEAVLGITAFAFDTLGARRVERLPQSSQREGRPARWLSARRRAPQQRGRCLRKRQRYPDLRPDPGAPFEADKLNC
jgi:hypothetical protein